ncbi:MAG: TnsA endonuclease N-terminal domain-containing protein [Allosphingosinicella sp.]
MKSAEQRYAERVKRRERDGMGKGTGLSYRPWLTVQSVPSHGLVHRCVGKIGRTHHLLSNGEVDCFNILDRSRHTYDIREQIPLLPLSETQEIAKEIGCRHPQELIRTPEGKRRVDHVMTTDFLIDLADADGFPPHLAISYKMRSDLDGTTSRKLKNLLDKAEIERRYWGRRGILFIFVTEAEIPEPVRLNFKLLSQHRDLTGFTCESEAAEVAAHLAEHIQAAPGAALKEHCNAVDQSLGLERGTAISLAFHSIWHRRWIVDLRRPIDANLPLLDLIVADPMRSS